MTNLKHIIKLIEQNQTKSMKYKNEVKSPYRQAGLRIQSAFCFLSPLFLLRSPKWKGKCLFIGKNMRNMNIFASREERIETYSRPPHLTGAYIGMNHQKLIWSRINPEASIKLELGLHGEIKGHGCVIEKLNVVGDYRGHQSRNMVSPQVWIHFQMSTTSLFFCLHFPLSSSYFLALFFYLIFCFNSHICWGIHRDAEQIYGLDPILQFASFMLTWNKDWLHGLGCMHADM